MAGALELVITPRALKDLARLPTADRDRVIRRIEAYAEEPSNPHHDVIGLVGRLSGLRLRVGDWRVMFTRSEGIMEVTRVMHRREAYR